MAITWPLKITPISVERKIASIIATRIDSADPDNPKIYTVPKALLDTPAHQVAAMDEIWDKHLTAEAKATAIDDFVKDLETQGQANLEARENG